MPRPLPLDALATVPEEVPLPSNQPIQLSTADSKITRRPNPPDMPTDAPPERPVELMDHAGQGRHAHLRVIRGPKTIKINHSQPLRVRRRSPQPHSDPTRLLQNHDKSLQAP
ncbi:hypothetical protein Adu01nite_56800 [Paractinoplanes durhamensis]|uniref:Uncharacterized protein n=1 Tax=Paractinoplanes durhamensis TaxID=113563 RepID=A0ABQ3Z3E8_9ACTN|nr:hypothetical protein Adu01nite_56800 [Actinoplanes durhamensis]